MRKLLIFLAALIITTVVFAQSPEKMSYQAVIRDANDELLTNQSVGMQISILQSSSNGTAVYVETHRITTNTNGLVSIEIGVGTIVSGDFSNIDWASDSYFIKTETDPNGGTNYSITGISQLLSVPYSLHSKTAETISGTVTENDPLFSSSIASGITDTDITNWNRKLDSITETDPVFSAWDKDYDDLINKPSRVDGSETKLIGGTNINITGEGTTTSPYVIDASKGTSSNNFYLGQDTLGGIVFHVYLDQNGEQHGLIVSKAETSAQWQSNISITNANRSWDGVYNMNLMTNSPAKTWVLGLGDGWYLPSVDELSILWQNRIHVNKGLNDAGATLLGLRGFALWSSMEYETDETKAYSFGYGSANSATKDNSRSVRAVKAF